MKKEFLKMAGVKSEKDFYELFPTEEHFFDLYPQAKKMMQNGGNTSLPQYKDQGIIGNVLYNPTEYATPTFKTGNNYTKMYQMGGGMQQQAAPQQGGGGQEEIINFVAQSLMQGEQPEAIVEQLVNQGIPQEQAVQLIQAVAQKLQEQQPQQPQMKYGGYSGTYDAGSGSYFKKGGPASPQEGEVYDMDEEQIQRLINLGYKIKYM
jgi:hypothetical protein